ncbi:ATP-binding cassette domain-containing protein, partial [Cognatilysobacter lacus]|uniref:ATP-binding cassette domain-containing protein n=1 Tax=Cognatilysobacter lacus TaxID=1643323 RepID=UPI001F410512
MPASPTPRSPLLDATGLRFSRNDDPVFGPLDLSVDTGEALLVQGENGAGKTTLLRVLAGLLRADEGVVRVDGAPFVAEHLLRALRSFAELAEASDQLAEELGGQPLRATGDTAFNDGMASEHEDPGAEYESHECHEFPPALMALLEL